MVQKSLWTFTTHIIQTDLASICSVLHSDEKLTHKFTQIN